MLFNFSTRLQKAHVDKSSFHLVWQASSERTWKSCNTILVHLCGWGVFFWCSCGAQVDVNHRTNKTTFSRKLKDCFSLKPKGVLWNPRARVVPEQRTSRRIRKHLETLVTSSCRFVSFVYESFNPSEHVFKKALKTFGKSSLSKEAESWAWKLGYRSERANYNTKWTQQLSAYLTHDVSKWTIQTYFPFLYNITLF